MWAVTTLLVLLFSMCGAQTQSTRTEVQTESQSTGAAAAVTTTLDLSSELRELRDMVVELRVLLTVTQNELQNTKIKMETEIEDLKMENAAQERELSVMKERLVVSETKVEALDKVNSSQDTELVAVKTELAVLKTRLAASETEVVNLRKETTAQTADLRSVTERLATTETDMEHVKKDTAAQHTDLTTMKTEVMNLIKANAAQDTDMTTVQTSLAAIESQVEDLKMETAAQEAELTLVKTRLAATETDVVNLEKEITEKPKVAFSAGLTDSGNLGAGNTDMNLVFTKIITNVGQAYSSATGFFTAPVEGVYYFRFTVMNYLISRAMTGRIYKNGKMVIKIDEYDTDGHPTYLAGGVTLQLEVGDLVNMRLPAGMWLYDDTDNHSTFSGFLLFPL